MHVATIKIAITNDNVKIPVIDFRTKCYLNLSTGNVSEFPYGN